MHYKELQLADTPFKTHEQLQIFKQPDIQLLYKKTHHLLLTVENILKDTEEHLTRTKV